MKEKHPTEIKKKIVFALIMGLISTGIISLSLIIINIGLRPSFIQIWLKSWGIAYILVIPAILFIAPWIERMVDRMFRNASQDVS